MSKGLGRAYLEETVDSVLSTPGAFDGAVHPEWFFTPEGRASTVHAKIHKHASPQPDCVAIGQIADAIREAVEAERKRCSESLDRVTGFVFGEIGVVIAERLDSPGEEPYAHWVIHQAGNSKRILGPWKCWEEETRKLLRDPAYIARTRMHFGIAFAIVNDMIEKHAQEAKHA